LLIISDDRGETSPQSYTAKKQPASESGFVAVEALPGKDILGDEELSKRWFYFVASTRCDNEY
jgi:hypothetical protein